MIKLENELKEEEGKKNLLNKRLYALNRMIDLISKRFKKICEKLNFFNKNMKFEAETSEGTSIKCKDFLERKMIEIIQLNTALAVLGKNYEEVGVESSGEGGEKGHKLLNLI